jgi:hypothetical protein
MLKGSPPEYERTNPRQSPAHRRQDGSAARCGEPSSGIGFVSSEYEKNSPPHRAEDGSARRTGLQRTRPPLGPADLTADLASSPPTARSKVRSSVLRNRAADRARSSVLRTLQRTLDRAYSGKSHHSCPVASDGVRKAVRRRVRRTERRTGPHLGPPDRAADLGSCRRMRRDLLLAVRGDFSLSRHDPRSAARSSGPSCGPGPQPGLPDRATILCAASA